MLFLWEIAHLLELTSLGAPLQEKPRHFQIGPCQNVFSSLHKGVTIEKEKASSRGPELSLDPANFQTFANPLNSSN